MSPQNSMICNLKFLGFTLERYKNSCHFDVIYSSFAKYIIGKKVMILHKFESYEHVYT